MEMYDQFVHFGFFYLFVICKLYYEDINFLWVVDFVVDFAKYLGTFREKYS